MRIDRAASSICNIKSIHLSIIIGYMCRVPQMGVVARRILSRIQGDLFLDAVNLYVSDGCPIRTRKEAKILMKGMVFLDDENDMLNGLCRSHV